MRKVFPIFAVLMAIMLAMVWLVGCGEDNGECDITVEVDKTVPGPGDEMAAYAEVSVTFKGGVPDEGSVKINGKVAECRGKTCMAGDLGLAEGEAVEIKIEWTYCDGKKSGEHSVTANTVECECCHTPPGVVEIYPENGAIDIDPLELQKEDVGIKIVFSEPIDTAKTGGIYIKYEDKSIEWLTNWSEHNTTLTLTYKEGAEIPYDTEITVVIEHVVDLTGNAHPEPLKLIFTTKAKE